MLDIQNNSDWTITFSFRWDPSSPWAAYTESPGQNEIFWDTYSSSLAPQVLYDTTSSADSQTTVNLVQGYGQWNGTGMPPESAATPYEFLNTSSGVEIYYWDTSPTPTPTNAVTEVLNESTYNITFDFRWTPSSSWTAYTESPGQGEIFWTTYSDSLTPQVLYDTTTSPDSQTTVWLEQGYGQWTGTGTPPDSSATPYQFQNTSTGLELYYAAVSPSPSPGPAPNAISSPNWSGYTIVSQANSVTAVNGTWNVPAVSAPPNGTYDSATWIGIDGYGGETVEQLGTGQDVVNGSPVYYAWWEMYSAGIGQPQQIISDMTIFPGDSISASVQYITAGVHAGQFYLSMTDNSRPNDSFSTYQSSSETQNPLAQRDTASGSWKPQQSAVSSPRCRTFRPSTSPARPR